VGQLGGLPSKAIVGVRRGRLLGRRSRLVARKVIRIG